jgi:hypothetical protein
VKRENKLVLKPLFFMVTMLGFVKISVPLGLGFFLVYKEPHQRTHERGHEGQDGFHHAARKWMMRVNSTNVLDEGLRIGGRGHRMNSTVEVSQTRRDYACIENKCGTQLAQSQYVPSRPLLVPIYRWPGLKDPVEFNANYNVRI